VSIDKPDDLDGFAQAGLFLDSVERGGLRCAIADGSPTNVSRIRSRIDLAVLGLLLVAVAIPLAITSLHVSEDQASSTQQYWCAGLAAIEGLVVLTLLLRLMQRPVQGLVLGKDKRLSTSKLQALLWTYTLVGILLAIVIANWIGQTSGLDTLIRDSLPQEYLLLLGAPFAAAVASKAVIATKVENGTVTKTEGGDTGATVRVKEAFGDDQGNTNLVDTQYLLFNFVALLYVIGGFIDTPGAGVPSIPGVLVGLTSVSAATYVSNKAVQRDVPTLTGVVPARAAKGQPVRILGRNLLIPAGEDSYHQVFVLFDKDLAPVIGLRKQDRDLVPDDVDAEQLPVHEDSGDDEFWVRVPEGADSGTVKVTVRNFKGVVTTDKVDFEITG
jgi:hypothetical protein